MRATRVRFAQEPPPSPTCRADDGRIGEGWTMDVETTAAIEHLSDRIERLETSVRAEFADVRAEMRHGFTSVRAELRAEMRDGFADMRSELRDEFRNGFEANRRYTDVLVEALRDDIRMLAEGFATIIVKLDSLQR
jgi:hypothetical protein